MFDHVIGELDRDWIKWITETRGGFHIILERNEQSAKKGFFDMKGIEIARNSMTLIPGTIQGGFKTKKILL
ncbi:MAG: hypothetical protein HeimC3_05720 [Candidatus Heimdallarchaeota archaeon LC_3]|nr:MAG: hypothetical protein HeimC3_05720 [Candidatus Heimdallarchaeota archaeon LC_3]